MAIELKIPAVGESITEVQIADWLKAEGDSVAKDENVVSVESEKASVDLPAPVSGRLVKIRKQKGDKASVGEVIAEFEKTESPEQPKSKAEKPVAQKSETSKKKTEKPQVAREVKQAVATEEPAEHPSVGKPKIIQSHPEHTEEHPNGEHETKPLPPAIQKSAAIAGEKLEQPESAGVATPKPAPTAGREEEVVPMTMLRRTVARRLVEAQQTMAMLTTFNEIDMSAVISLRQQQQEAFQKKHQTKLGFMSFFVKATIEALKSVPQLNAEVRGDDIVFRNYYDIGVAIGSERGLVVPVLRSAEGMSFAEIEKAIGEFAVRAKENKLKLEELQGGTFTITNGGVYGSLLSTPIINPPQSGILGMHTIQERPVALNGAVVIRPMMYVALSYDHRIVDGREAVTFLKRVKELIETPARILLEV